MAIAVTDPLPMSSPNLLKTTTLIVTPIQACKCGTRIDVSKYEPLQELTCPSCMGPFLVQGQLDRFQLTGIAGHGGAGTVYKAFDPQLGRQVALKIVREDRAGDEEVLAQLESEAQITASLNHPHVLRVFSVGRSQGRFYIAMELVAGGSLDDYLTKHPVLPEAQALDIAIQMAEGLNAAHQAGLVHRDVKPGNVLFANSTAKVMDFGLAVFEQLSAGASGTVWGSPINMAPERLEGLAEDFRSDIYSLGTVLYQMLTGKPVFDAPTPQQVALKRLSTAAPSVLTFAPRTSNATAFIVKKMLEKDRDLRFQSYAEMIESLRFAREELGQKGAVKTPRVVLDAPDQRKASMWMTVAFGAFFVVASVVGVIMVRKSRARDEVSEIPKWENEPKKEEAIAPVASSSNPAPQPTAPTASSYAPLSTPAQSASIASGLYKLKNRANGQCLDVSAWSSNNDAPIKMWQSGSGLNQRWMVRSNQDGYQIVALHSCKGLEVTNGSSEDGATIRHANISSVPQQVWKIEVAEEGNYRLVSKTSGKALTVLNTGAVSGSSVGQRTRSNDPAQQWKLEPLGGFPSELNAILDREPMGPTPPSVSAKMATDPKGTKFVPISLEGVMNCDSRKGSFLDVNSKEHTVHPLMTGWVEAGPATFKVLDVNKASNGKDLLVLRGGTGIARDYTKKVEVPVNGAKLSKLHFLSGVAGWGFPWDRNDNHLGVLAAQVTIVRQGGAQQVIQFRNGIEFADYNERAEVPGSAYVQGLADYGKQVRYFSRALSGSDPVEKLIIESFETNLAPIFLAITGETEK